MTKHRTRRDQMSPDEDSGQREDLERKENDQPDEFVNDVSDLIERIEELESDMEEAKKYSHLAADALEMLHQRLEKLETLVVNYLKIQGIQFKDNEEPENDDEEAIKPEGSSSSPGIVYL